MEKDISSENITLSEDAMKKLVRNALMVAGQEMGKTGDHWPVVKRTIEDIMRDWEQLEIERAVHAEMKKHLYEQLRAMEDIVDTCRPEIREQATSRLGELREIYDAFFEDVRDTFPEEVDEENLPLHVRRAHAIIDTLEETDHE